MIRFAIVCLFYVAFANAVSAQGYSKYEPPWVGQHLKIDLSKIPGFASKLDVIYLDFSKDSRTLCIFNWLPSEIVDKEYNPVKPKRLFYDLSGKRIDGILNTDGYFNAAYENLFDLAVPKASPSILNVYQYNYAGRAVPLTEIFPYVNVFRNTREWVFNEDFTKCAVMKSNNFDEDAEKTIELWQVKPTEKKIWSVKCDKSSSAWKAASFLRVRGKKYIFILFFPSRDAILYDEESGQIINSKTIEGNESKAQLEIYRKAIKAKNSRAKDPDSIDWLQFLTESADINTTTNILASGAEYGRRVRLRSINKEYNIQSEIHTYDSIFYPNGGIWKTDRVKFVNNYLIVDYSWGGRGSIFGAKEIYTTEIYDSRSMKLLWHKNSVISENIFGHKQLEMIDGVTISPDGKKIAFIRNGAVEIGDFVPN